MKQKKGGVKLSTEGIIGIVLVIPILIVGFYFISSAYNVFISSNDHSVQEFYALTAEIDSMLESTDKVSYTTYPYYISGDYILVGFDSEWDDGTKITIHNSEEDSDGENIIKPDKCLGKACLCLYEENAARDFENEEPYRCYTFGSYDDNIEITGSDGFEQYFSNGKDIEDSWYARASKRYFFFYNSTIPELILSTFLDQDQIDQILENQTTVDYESPFNYENPKEGTNDAFLKNAAYDFNFTDLFPLNYEYLVIYGESKSGCQAVSEENDEICEQPYSSFGSRVLYIEKVTEAGKGTNILIAPLEGYVYDRLESVEQITLPNPLTDFSKSSYLCGNSGSYGNKFDSNTLLKWAAETGYNPCYIAAFVQAECSWLINQACNIYGYCGMFQWGAASFTDMVGEDKSLCDEDPKYPNTCQLDSHEDIIDLSLRSQLDVLGEYLDMRGITPEDDLDKMYQAVAFPWCMNLDRTSDDYTNKNLSEIVPGTSTANPLWRYPDGPDYATCKGVAYYAHTKALADPSLSCSCECEPATTPTCFIPTDLGNGEIGNIKAINGIDCEASDCRLGEGTLTQLLAARSIAQVSGYDISVTSAYRSPATQRDLYIQNGCDRESVCGVDIGEGECSVSNPIVNDPSSYTHCPHASGGAVDMYIYTSDVSTDFTLGEYKAYGNYQFTDEQKANHKILENIMCQAGFVRYGDEERTTGEWWHFEYGTDRWQRGTSAGVCTIV